MGVVYYFGDECSNGGIDEFMYDYYAHKNYQKPAFSGLTVGIWMIQKKKRLCVFD